MAYHHHKKRTKKREGQKGMVIHFYTSSHYRYYISLHTHLHTAPHPHTTCIYHSTPSTVPNMYTITFYRTTVVLQENICSIAHRRFRYVSFFCPSVLHDTNYVVSCYVMSRQHILMHSMQAHIHTVHSYTIY